MFYVCLQFGVKLVTCLVVLDSVQNDAKRNFCVYFAEAARCYTAAVITGTSTCNARLMSECLPLHIWRIIKVRNMK